MNEEKNGYKSGSRLEKILKSGQFALTGELGPPKSADIDVIDKKCGHLKGKVDAVNITDNQTAIVRMSSIAAGALALQRGLEPVIQMTCRDRNRIAIQSDILGAYALGMKNLLCLTGDHQVFGNHPTSKNVFDLDSIKLVYMIKRMRDEGKFLCDDEIKNSKKAPLAPPKMFIGAAANPFADPFEFRVQRLAKKVTAGVDFIQTQCIYNMDKFKRWMKGVVEAGLHEKVKIMAGITPLKSLGMARYMAKNVSGIEVPDELIQRMKGAPKGKKAAEGIKIAVEQMQEVREIEGVAGIHLMAIEWEERVPEIIKAAGLHPRPTPST